MKTYICSKCKSSNITFRSGAYWDMETQKMLADDWSEFVHCYQCESDQKYLIKNIDLATNNCLVISSTGKYKCHRVEYHNEVIIKDGESISLKGTLDECNGYIYDSKINNTDSIRNNIH